MNKSELRPKVGIGVIIVKDNKVLYGKRKKGHEKGFWCFPGGHLEFDEEFDECAIREVMEETGIKIKNIRFAALTNDIFKKERKHYITVFMLADYSSGQVKESKELGSLKWVEWHKQPEPLFLPNINLLKQNYNPFKR